MGRLFMFFVYAFFFYLIYKAIRYFFQYMSEPEQSKNKNSGIKKTEPKLQIKKEDIIDAEFEELKNEKKENLKN